MEYQSNSNKIEFLEFLCHFNDSELIEFQNFISNPFFQRFENQKKELCNIYNYILKKTKKNKIINEQLIQSILKHFQLKDKNTLIEKYFARLNELLKWYMLTVSIKYENNFFEKPSFKITNWNKLSNFAISSNKLELAEKFIEKANTNHKKTNLHNLNYYTEKVESINLELKVFYQKGINYKKINKSDITKHEEIMLIVQALGIYIELLNLDDVRQFNKSSKENKLFENMVELAKSKIKDANITSIKKDPFNYMKYQLSLIELLKNKNIESFNFSYDIFKKLYRFFNKNEKIYAINLLYNFLIIEEKKGNFNYERMYELNEKYLKDNLLIQNNSVNILKFQGILTVLFKLNKLTKAKYVYEKFAIYIEENDKNDMSLYFKAIMAFYEKKYEKAFDLVSSWNLSNSKTKINFEMRNLMLQLKSLYEKESKTIEEFVLSKKKDKKFLSLSLKAQEKIWKESLQKNVTHNLTIFENSKNAFKRNKYQNERSKTFFISFIIIITKLYKLKLKLIGINHSEITNARVTIKQLSVEIQEKKVNLFWFEEKIKELKDLFT